MSGSSARASPFPPTAPSRNPRSCCASPPTERSGGPEHHLGSRLTSTPAFVVSPDTDQAPRRVVHAVWPVEAGGREDPPVRRGDGLLRLDADGGQMRDRTLERKQR